MTNTLSLGPVLDLIERWQQWVHSDPGFDEDMPCDAERALLAIDLRVLKELAEQHAAQLRKLRWNMAPMYEQGVLDAADFLAAPRREQEGE